MSDVARLMELARQYVPPPAVVDNPAVTPVTANVGDSLNCTMGNWSGEPSAYLYSWLSDATVVVGSAPDYVVADSDAGHSLTCVVTASNVIGSTQAPPSNAVAIPAAGGMRAEESPVRQTGRSRS
jgi:hypothetical protein